MKAKDIFLTASIIARDSSELIEKCITSVKGVVDQIVVLDTGSVDDTVKIARKLGAEVYFYKWNNDFSSARNEALKYAKGNWIFQIDTDHELVFEKNFNLKNYLRKTDKVGFFITEKSLLSRGDIKTLDRLLLFKNVTGLKYEGIIHEHPVKSLREYANKKNISEPFGKIKEISIFHYGFIDIDKKMERNVHILKLGISREPYNWHYRYKLILSYKGLGDLDNYKKLLIETMSLIKSRFPKFPTTALIGVVGLILEYMVEKDFYDKKVIDYAEYLSKVSKYTDIRVIYPLARIYLINGDVNGAFSILHWHFNSGGTPGYIPVNSEVKKSATRLYQELAVKINRNDIKLILNR